MTLALVVPKGSEISKRSGVRIPFGKRMVLYYGFPIMEELLPRCKVQLEAIASLNQIQKQFIGTLVDTESAVGYYIRKSNVSGATWVSYISAKMKYAGDLAYFAKLISHLPPTRGLYANTIKQSLDLRWSLNVHGIVAFTTLRQVMPYLHNEKSIIEVDCILKHGPTVNATQPHPFIQCGAFRVRRGVWYWPQIDGDTSPLDTTSTAIK